MPPERWQKITEVFDAALERLPADRSGFLDGACSGDKELRAEVESLLSEHERVGSFIANPALGSENPMIAVGTRLGPYEVVSPLGAGGMGEVYRAEDSKLGRQVAIKVLPDVFARDHERLARFEREAKILASLNHPNIASIYGLEEAKDKRFLVLELVEGQTLAERLHKNPLPLDDTLDICRQITEGRGAAIEK